VARAVRMASQRRFSTKIVGAAIAKFYEEVCLLDQPL